MGLPPPVAKSYPHDSQNRSLAGVPQSGQGVPPAGREGSACVPDALLAEAAGVAPRRSPQTSQ